MQTSDEAKKKECPFRLAKSKLVTDGYTKYEYAKCLGNECSKWRLNMDFPCKISAKCARNIQSERRGFSGDTDWLESIRKCQQSNGKHSCAQCWIDNGNKYINDKFADDFVTDTPADLAIDQDIIFAACLREHNVKSCLDCGEAYGYCGG